MKFCTGWSAGLYRKILIPHLYFFYLQDDIKFLVLFFTPCLLVTTPYQSFDTAGGKCT